MTLIGYARVPTGEQTTDPQADELRRAGCKVVECDAGTVHILQENGAEFDLPVGELTATPPKVKSCAAPAAAGYVMPERRLTAADITSEHVRVLGTIPVRTLQAIAALCVRRKTRASMLWMSRRS